MKHKFKVRVFELAKAFLAYMPDRLQEEFKRWHYRRQIRSGRFTTDEPEFNLLEKIVSKDDWVIDVGANIGHYTIKLSDLVGPQGRILAFEPSPTTFQHLSENSLFFANQNTTLINAAASDKTQSVGISVPRFSSGLKNYYQAGISTRTNNHEFYVLSLAIDSLELPERVSLVKIDAEGHEEYVFNGMKKLIERDKPTLIIETVTDAIRQTLLDHGYIEKHLENSPNTIFVFGRSEQTDSIFKKR